MYLLDTDVLSNLIKRAPSPQLIAKLVTVPPEQQFTSSISLGEMLYGAHRHPQATPVVLQRIDTLFSQDLTILPFDADAAHYYGRVRALLERRGTPLAEADLRIASIALSRDLVMVTGNVRHFQRVPGLQVENWLV
jgi:predicted nucleic acid-binding protein